MTDANPKTYKHNNKSKGNMLQIQKTFNTTARNDELQDAEPYIAFNLRTELYDFGL